MNALAMGLGRGWPGWVAWVGAIESWAAAERGRFVPWLAVGMAAGVVGYFWLGVEPAWWWGLAGLGVGGALAVLGWGVAGVWGAGLRGVALMGVAGALGFGSGQWAGGRALGVEALPLRAVVVSGVVRGVDVLADGRRLVVEGARLGGGVPLRRLVRVRMKRGDEGVVAAGDRVEVRALLRAPSGPAYPGGWDQQRDAYFAGVAGGGSALSAVTVLERAAPSGVATWLQGVRDAVAGRAMAALPGAAGAVAATLLTGTTRAIPEVDRAAFRDSGLAHLLAVAGLHIGIVMGLFMLGTRLGLAAWPHAALHWPTKAIAACTALAAGACYLILTGGHVPILRSFAMASLVTLGIVVGRRALSMRGLALAAVAIMLVAPNEVVGVSFQMSFSAVAALIAGYEALRPVLARLHSSRGGPGWRRVGAHVAALVLTSLLAGTASMPYGAYHFGHVQAYYVLSNVVAVPLTAMWVLPLGIAALALMPFGLEHWAFVPMGWGLEGIIWVARGVAGWPAATAAVPPVPGWGLVVFSLGLAWLCLWRTRVRLWALPVVLVGLLSPVLAVQPDVLVSSDARLIAWRGAEGWRLQARPGSPWFVRDAWRDHLAVGIWLPARCGVGGCRVGGALILQEGAVDCAGVSVVVSAEPARGVCPGAALVDRFSVWRDGSHALWLGGAAPVVVSDRADRGVRPWVPGLPVPARRVPNLPMAPVDVLPASPVDVLPAAPVDVLPVGALPAAMED